MPEACNLRHQVAKHVRLGRTWDVGQP